MRFTEKVWVSVEEQFKFKETIDPKTGEKKFRLRGLMLPFNTVSRNKVLYNADSIKEKAKHLIHRPLMYNHQVDSRSDLPYGHFTDSVVMEGGALPGWENVYSKDGWYYEADIDPAERDIIRKLNRGDLRHVSIQLVGDNVEESFDKDGNNYTEAWVGDIIEGSLVPCPGFLDTTTLMAEAFGKKEDATTSNIPSQTKIVKKKEEIKVNAKHIKILKDNNIDFTKIGDELLIDENDGKILDGLGIPYKEFKEDHVTKGVFPIEQFTKGIEIEQGEHKDINVLEVAQLVLDHLKEDEYYYNKEEKVTSDPRLPLMEEEIDKEVKEFMKLGENKINKILSNI